MISRELYEDISKQWGSHGVIYQKYNRLETRYPLLLKELGVFKGKHVLEVGANAGMAAYEITKFARQYTGVERATGYWRQSQITQKYIENKNVTFYNCSIKSYIKRLLRGDITDKPSACYLSYVLYHFENKEVEMFKEHILPLLDVIVLQSRFSKRNLKGRTKHNDYGFWHPDKVMKYLRSAGFTVEKLLWHEEKKFHLIVAKKGCGDVNTGESGIHTEGQSAGAGRRSAPERVGRTAQGKPLSDAGRETTPKGPGGSLLAEGRDDGGESLL